MSTPPSPSPHQFRLFRLAAIEGCNPNEIARQLGIERAEVERSIHEVERYLATQVVIVEPQVIGQVHIQRLELQWRELMEAWRKSTQEQIISKAATDKEGKQRAEVTRKSSAGDPRFLEQARRVLAEIRGLLRVVPQPADEESFGHVSAATVERRFEEVDRRLAEKGESQRTDADVRADHGQADVPAPPGGGHEPPAGRDAA